MEPSGLGAINYFESFQIKVWPSIEVFIITAVKLVFRLNMPINYGVF